MPIYCWYLLRNFLRVFFLSVTSFIAILLVSRLEEIAQFAAMGARLLYLVLFILYQVPYILPIAMPISCLISAIILFLGMSHTHELTALRSSGFSLKRLLTPILVVAAFLSLATFFITSELATASHLATRKMVHQLSSVNPLLLLQSAKIARLQDAYVQMDPVRNGELAQNLIIALNNPSCERLNLCLAKQIEMEKENLKVKHISIISSTPSKEGFDHLIIENQASMSASAPEFAKLLRKSGWKMANDHLKFSLLRVKAKRLRDQVKEGNSNIRVLNKCHSEMVRRFSLGLAAFSFTLLGLAYGIEISRQHKKRGIAFVLALTTICLIAFCMGKALSHVFWLATFLFLFPHVCLILASCWAINRVNRGIE